VIQMKKKSILTQYNMENDRVTEEKNYKKTHAFFRFTTKVVKATWKIGLSILLIIWRNSSSH